jgi:peptidoglycan/LPS O-acetylase OafA/YrhL
VLASHCGDIFANWLGGRAPEWLSVSGFFGVELFFVLSGFLIGRLLLGIIAEPPSLRAWGVFMARRWMRTLPIYFLWIAVLAVIWPPQPWSQVAHYATLTQNLAWPMPSGWFGVSWSLTVEEWFYLGFSALLLSAAGLFGRRAGFWAATTVFLVVPAVLRWRMPESADFGEVLSKVAVLRLDAIAFGVVLAWMQDRRGFVFCHPAPMLAVGMLLILGIWSGWFDRHVPLDPHVRRTFLFDAGSLGFALCLPAAAALGRLPRLAASIVTAISTRSYAIYIVHLSVLEIVGAYRDRWHTPIWLAAAFSLAVIWALSSASWRWIEAPILACRPSQSRPPASGRMPVYQ